MPKLISNASTRKEGRGEGTGPPLCTRGLFLCASGALAMGRRSRALG
jgi:hypothetical protein